MVVNDGRVVALGNLEQLLNDFSPLHRLDFGDSFVFPGFFDPHCHFLDYGYLLQEANLYGARSWEETVERLVVHKQRSSGNSQVGMLQGSAGGSPRSWLVGRGWDQNLWQSQEFPDRKLLDRAFPDTPVIARRVDSHAAIVNGKALELAGIGSHSHIDGGVVVVQDGWLTGLLLDNAISLVAHAMPARSEEEKRAAVAEAQKACFAAGLTSVSNAGTRAKDAQLIRAMQGEGAMRLRMYAMLEANEENFALFAQAGQGPVVEGGLSIRAFKLYADGALGSRGAYLLEPYADDPTTCGLQTLQKDDLRRVCTLAKAHGFQVNVHAIGDAAVRMVLDVYEEFLVPGNDLRWRIEHAQIVHPDDIPRFGRFCIIPSIQTTHATSDMKWVSQRLGSERMPRAYPHRALLNQNGWLPNGSDFPIEPIEPTRGFHSAVTRKDDKGEPEGGFQPENCFSREEALKAMTLWAARANFEETERGSLSVGKLADFTVLDTDLMSAPEEKLRRPTVLATALGGSLVYEAH